jgi:hypothetical protein
MIPADFAPLVPFAFLLAVPIIGIFRPRTTRDVPLAASGQPGRAEQVVGEVELGLFVIKPAMGTEGAFTVRRYGRQPGTPLSGSVSRE